MQKKQSQKERIELISFSRAEDLQTFTKMASPGKKQT
jgi:hypothetical protein